VRKISGDLSSARERRSARDSSIARGKGAWGTGGGSQAFIMAGGAREAVTVGV
jgi:hypothetical protein